MSRLKLLIITALVSFSCFSQNVIDSTSIQLKPEVARLVIKDLVRGDAARKEVELLREKISILEIKSSKQDSVIVYKDILLLNQTNLTTLAEKESQFGRDLNKDLVNTLRKANIKSVLYKTSTGLALVAIAVIILQ